jgi:hypothetical protein
MNQSGLATSEMKQIIAPNDLKIKARFAISKIFAKMNFHWMTAEVLACDEHKLRAYAHIAFFYNSTEELDRILKAAGITNYADCDSCNETCTPFYLYGIREKRYPLCKQCAGIELN